MIIHGHGVRGAVIDTQTRCEHYHNKVDIIAIKFKCCGNYYPCIKCHKEEADHRVEVWPKNEFSEKAILCGVCGAELTIEEYITSGSACPNCAERFNAGCANHYHLYFDMT